MKGRWSLHVIPCLSSSFFLETCSNFVVARVERYKKKSKQLWCLLIVCSWSRFATNFLEARSVQCSLSSPRIVREIIWIFSEGSEGEPDWNTRSEAPIGVALRGRRPRKNTAVSTRKTRKKESGDVIAARYKMQSPRRRRDAASEPAARPRQFAARQGGYC